ncbi:ABC transporter substrate-binding protein [Anaerocolumna sedimenticola]|uniref:ABC transporter substrate-binding protein n=1 Tax=Anaerocolumna sedimenticola TaxID=2696063 RepID=A0A6P1TME2_9FIRM|nr:ABC transporter substrate-binding protein [Anaerocolumna sedimenticola]QHQ61026.1 ABC transporter substrate-binding protein [Anaerocolumna sedimenticola]
MKKSILKKAQSALLIFCMLFSLTACGGAESTSSESGKSEASDSDSKPVSTDGKMTDVGTPRSETLIVDILSGRIANPDLYNPYVPGNVPMDAGVHQLIHGYLWEIDTVKGEQYPDLAATMPEQVEGKENTYTFKMKENLKWSDGEALDAHDVAFTFNMLLESKELAFGAVVRETVVSCQALDDLTVEIVTHNPEPKLSQKFGVTIFGNGLCIVPEHVWKNENPATFTDSNPLSSGPYILKDKDPQGYWFLYEKREDWKNTAVGQTVGEPGPKYILFKSFGTEEKRIMAAISNEIDVLQDITPESWEILRKKNTESMAWYSGFPYADTNDPCERGIGFNCSDPIYGNVNVRWALALATDIKSVSLATFSGMLRVSPLQLPPTDVLMDTYHKPMVDWLKAFTLEDGYKPFDDSYAKEIVEVLKQQGMEGLPETEQDIIDVFGVGWWKYDVEQAAKMLNKEGFTKKDDTWYKPDGSVWEMSILAPADFEIQSMRLAFAVADSWNKFGIKVTVVQQDAATFWNNEATGNFEAGSYWPACGIMPDSSVNMEHWNSKYIVPTGEQAPGNRYRWGGETNDKVTEKLNELMQLPSDDPKVIDGVTEICKLFVEELPFIPMFGTSKFVPVTTHYWTGFQTAENDFEGPWWWWSQFKYYTPHLKPTGN